MRINSIEICNFMNIRKAKLQILNNGNIEVGENPDIIGIYGANGTGKSALVKAIRLLKFFFRDDLDYAENTFHQLIPNNVSCAKFKYEFNNAIYSFSVRSHNSRVQIFDEKIKIMNSKNHKTEMILNMGERTYKKNCWEIVDVFSSSSDDEIRKAQYEHLESIYKSSRKNSISFFAYNFLVFDAGGNFFANSPYESEYKIKESINMHLVDWLCFYIKNNILIYDDIETSNSRLGFKDICTSECIQYGLDQEKFNDLVRTYIELDEETGQLKDCDSPHVLDRCIKYIEYASNVFSSLFPGRSMYLNEQNQLISVNGNHEIPMVFESYGIRKMFSLVKPLFLIFNSPDYILFVDEFDEGIFEYMLGELLVAFKKHGKGQLVFSAHNLRPLEVLDKNNLVFTIDNPDDRYVTLKNIKPTHNIRDTYLRMIVLSDYENVSSTSNNKGKLYNGADSYTIARALDKAGDIEYV